jgi:drug/metabolite transporter (DMT)-like permease
MSRWQADSLLALVALIWGSTFVVVKNALDAVGPFTFVAWRFWLAASLLVILFRHRLRGLGRGELLAGGLIGLWLALGYILQTIGLQYTTTGKAGFITGLNVVMVPVFATLLLRRPPGRAPLIGILSAAVGLGFLSLDTNLRFGPGDVWVLGCAVGFALHIVSVSRFAPRYDPIRLAIVQIAAVAILATLAAFVFDSPDLRLPIATWGAVAFTGVVATALVFSLQVHVQRFTTPTHVALVFSLEPVFAALFGWWWAHETLGPKELLGCGLILVGMIVAELGATGSEVGKPAMEIGD